MRPYTPETNKGRILARDEIHKRTADGGRRAEKAKACRKAARREGRAVVDEALRENKERGISPAP